MQSKARKASKRSLTEKESKLWNSRIRRATTYQKKNIGDRGKQNLAYYKSDIGPLKDLDGSSWIYVNQAFSVINTIATSIFNHNPTVTFNHERDKDSVFAKIWSQALNLELKWLNVKDLAHESIIDAGIFGFGYTKVFLTQQTEVDEEKAAELQAKKEQLEQVARILPSVYPGDPNLPQITMLREKLVDKINQLEGTIEKVLGTDISIGKGNPIAFLIPETTRSHDVEALPWIDFVYLRSPLEIKRQFGIVVEGEIFKEDFSAGDENNEVYSDVEAEQKHEEGMVKIHEIWDKEKKEVIFLLDKAHKTNNVLIDDSLDLAVIDDPFGFPDFFPIPTLHFNRTPGTFFPMSDIDLIKPQLNVINAVRSSVEDHRRRFVRRYVFNSILKDVTEAKIRKVVNGKDGSVFGLPLPIGFSMRDFLAPIEDAPLSQETYQAATMAQGDIFEILGLPDFIRGGTNKTKSATEANYMQQSVVNKLQDRVDQLEAYIGDIAKKTAYLMIRFYSAERIISMVGDSAFGKKDPAELALLKSEFTAKWNYYHDNKVDVFRDLNLNVVAGTTIKPDKNNMMRNLREVLAEAIKYNQFLLTAPQLAGKFRLMNIEKIYTRILSLDNEAIKNPDDYFIDFQSSMGMPPQIGQGGGQPGAGPALPPALNLVPPQAA